MRRLRLLPSAAGAFIFLACQLPAGAQTAPVTGVVYKLDDEATFQRGCFAPCECPVMEEAPVRGTFRLSPSSVDPQFAHYDVTQVDWNVHRSDGSVLAVMGSGTFKIGGEVAVQEQLALDLVVGSDPKQHFDSGLVVPTVPFPLIDLKISIHGEYCFDTVFRVHARPVPRLEVDRGDVRWDPDPPASRYDVVGGDLNRLRATSGDFRVATDECVAYDSSAESVAFTDTPAPGGAYWFLERVDGGSYDAWDATIATSRDAGIDASPVSCR